MKLTKIASVVAVALVSIQAAFSQTVSFSGSALQAVTGLTAAGQKAVYIVDNTGNTITNFNQIALLSGASITANASYGTNITVIGNVNSTNLGAVRVGGISNIALTANVATGNRFAIVVFSTSTTTANAGDTYRVWTDPTWLIPAGGSTVSFQNPAAGQFQQLISTNSPVALLTSTVPTAVPEPSTFATVAGLMSLTFVACRRRKVTTTTV